MPTEKKNTDFDSEVEALRANSAFQKFLDGRSASRHRIALEDLDAEIERDLKNQRKKNS